ncbi:lipoprotein NlpI [Thalassovita gelatinovora]|uniref:Lipoprotein NlpI n=2 Tax=Thalassovita gelatinovora TaxID=53501 RepID=A0A0P1FH03_THAGE|nr:lipoprotein NlpI [Thalassovita gelatinovora]SEP77879.1 Tetratricopeptide repeat-containing protein [Thalassovita gelatinovora]
MMKNWVTSAVLTIAIGVSGVSPVQAQGLAGSYLAARQAGMTADYKTAAEYYARALARDPSNPALLESAAQAQLSLGRLDRAIPMARQLEEFGPDSQIAQMILMADDAEHERFDKLDARSNQERSVGPLVDGLVQAWAKMGQGQVSAALKIYDDVAEKRGLQGFALYHKALALASVGDFESAEAIFSENVGTTMQVTRRGAIAHVEMLSQLDRGADAAQMIVGLFGPDLDPVLRDMHAVLDKGESLPFTMVRSPKEGVAEVFYSVAAALSTEAGQDYTLLYSRVAEYLRPDHTDAILLSAGLLEDLQRYDLAVDAYKKVSRDNPAFHAAELGRAEALRKSGRVDAAVEVLEQLAKSHGDQAIVNVTLGDLMRQLDRFEDAVAAYDAALALHEGTDPSQWFIYYARAICYERLNEWDRAEKDFRTALDLNPEHPQVLNYLGYSMVEQQVKLDEALDMIERAVAARPDSGYIVDSLGWVLFRLGRYDEAVPHMERAAELMPVDPVVNDHLGDVLWAVGRKREAEFQWRRALSFVDYEDAAGEVDPDRIRQKLEIGLDAVLIAEGAPPLKVANGEH